MIFLARGLAICGAGLFLATSSQTVFAQPPQSCARKFIGNWGWTSSTGIHTIHDYQADGSAICSGNPFCVRGATWTCNGNQFTYNNTMSDTVLTLSPDGSRMTGIGGFPPNPQIVVRMGRGVPGGMPPNAVGTGGRAPAVDYSAKGNALRFAQQNINAAEAAARVARGESTYNNWSIVEDRYRDAARLYREAGETEKAAAAERNANKVKETYSKIEQRPATPQKQQQTAAKPSKQQPAEPDSCKAAKAQVSTMSAAGADAYEISKLRIKLRELGCRL